MTPRNLLSTAVLATICAGSTACSPTGPSGSATTTVPPDPTLIVDFFGGGFAPNPSQIAADAGGRGSADLTVQGPGTIIVSVDWTTSPPGEPAKIIITLLRVEGATAYCEEWVNELCLGVANALGAEKPKTLTHKVGDGAHTFVAVLRNLGPAGAAATGTVRFEKSQ